MGRRASAAVALVWTRRIARQRRGRFSVVAFCRREGVSPKSFYAWRRRLQVDASRAARQVDPSRAALHVDASRGTRSGARRAASRLFVPVELPAAMLAGIRIELPGGAVAILPVDASAGLLCAAIRAAVRATSSRTATEPSSC